MVDLTHLNVFRKIAKNLYYKLFKPRSLWHMRNFSNDFYFEPKSHVGLGTAKLSIRPFESIQSQMTRCMIVASGPSLLDFRCVLLENAAVIAVNGSIHWLLSKDKAPDFYVVSDPNFIDTQWEIFRTSLTQKDCHLILSAVVCQAVLMKDPLSLNHIAAQGRLSVFDESNMPFGKRRTKNDGKETSHSTPMLGVNGFSDSGDRGFSTGGTVVFIALQLAAQLAYQEIGIVGMDLGGTGKKRAYHEHKPAPMKLEGMYESHILPAMILAAAYFKQKGVAVKNLSLESRLPASVFPKFRNMDVVVTPK